MNVVDQGRVRLGLIHVTPITFDRAVRTIVELADEDRANVVVTPNIAHVWQAKDNDALVEIYRHAAIAPPDGWPVVSVLRHLLAADEPVERVTGADLLPALAAQGRSIALVGGRADSAERAGKRLKEANPSLTIRLTEPVPIGELDDPERRASLIRRISEADSDFIFLGLGVPKQELLALDLLDSMPRGVILCVGAAIEFAAGEISRAPRLVTRLKAEWLYRLALEPKRLFRRYSRSAPYFLAVVIRELRAKRAAPGSH